MGAAAIPLMGVGLGVAAVGIGIDAYGKYKTGKFNADMADRNAEVLELSKADSLIRLAKNEEVIARQAAQAISQEKTSAAAGNVALDSGSVVDTIHSIQSREAEDITQLAENVRFELMGVDNQQTDLRLQGEMSRRGARGALVGGAVNIVGTSLSGAGQISHAATRRGAVQ